MATAIEESSPGNPERILEEWQLYILTPPPCELEALAKWHDDLETLNGFVNWTTDGGAEFEDFTPDAEVVKVAFTDVWIATKAVGAILRGEDPGEPLPPPKDRHEFGAKLMRELARFAAEDLLPPGDIGSLFFRAGKRLLGEEAADV